MAQQRTAVSGVGFLMGRVGLWPGGALANARSASVALAGAVEDREALTAALDDADADPQPGDLTRLGRAECWELLAGRSVGRLACIARAGVPDVVPVNYVVHRGELLLRSGPGPKQQAAERREQVAFEVDAFDESQRQGWSVVVAGRLTRLAPAEQVRLARGDVPMPVPWARGARSAVLRLTPTRLDGRRLW